MEGRREGIAEENEEGTGKLMGARCTLLLAHPSMLCLFSPLSAAPPEGCVGLLRLPFLSLSLSLIIFVFLSFFLFLFLAFCLS